MVIKFSGTKIILTALKECFIKSTKHSLFYIVAIISKASLGVTFIFEGDIFRSVYYYKFRQTLGKGEYS